MNPIAFRHVIRPQATGTSRRGLLAGLGGISAALHFALFANNSAEDAVARKKSKKRKKKAAVPSPPPPDLPPSPPSPPSPPGPDLVYQCAAGPDGEVCGSAMTRLAQTFTVSKTGSLRRIAFEIKKTGSTAIDYSVQLVAVNGGIPSSSPADVLAAVTIPGDTVPVGFATLTADFNGPTLVPATAYAAVISRPGSDDLCVRVRNEIGSTGCLGLGFHATGGNAFNDYADLDLNVSVFIA